MREQQTWMVTYPVVVVKGSGVSDSEVLEYLKSGISLQMPRLSMDNDGPLSGVEVVECGSPLLRLSATTEVDDECTDEDTGDEGSTSTPTGGD